MGQTTTKDKRDVYFVHPIVDVLVAGGGLSMILFLALFALSVGSAAPGESFASTRFGARSAVFWNAAWFLSFVVNYPHFAATNFRLYQSFDRMMQFPKTAFLSPVLVCAGLYLALTDAAFAPWYLKLFLVWSGYHYSGQTKGICLIYARRLGVEVDGFTRKLIVVASYGSWAYTALRAESSPDWGPYYEITVPAGIPFLLKRFPEGPTSVVAMVILAATVTAFVMLFVTTFLRQKRSFPIAAAAPIAAQMLWYVLGPYLPSFNEFVPFFHSFQYLIIAWVFQLKEESATPGYQPATRTVVLETLKWGTGVVLGGLVLFEVTPYMVSASGYTLALSYATINAAVQIHHFFVDGVIWKIRDPKTRSNLAGNVLDLAGAPRASVATTAAVAV